MTGSVSPREERMPQHIVVTGTSGAGKPTFATELANQRGLAYVELDALHWGPNWSEPTTDNFRACVSAALVVGAAAQGAVAPRRIPTRLLPIPDTWAEITTWIGSQTTDLHRHRSAVAAPRAKEPKLTILAAPTSCGQNRFADRCTAVRPDRHRRRRGRIPGDRLRRRRCFGGTRPAWGRRSTGDRTPWRNHRPC
jgi:hypothetical protein